MKLKIYLIVNPLAGEGRSQKAAQQIIAYLQEKEVPHEVFYTEYSQHSKKIAYELVQNSLRKWTDERADEFFPLLVVLGGDGTLHEVVNTFQPDYPNIPVGYLPCGSGNDFARGAGISRTPLIALQQILEAEEPRKINLLHFQDAKNNFAGYVVNNLGIGLEANIVNAANDSLTKKNLNKYQMGSLSYLFSVIKVLFKQKGFPIDFVIDGKKIHFDNAFLCTTTNHPYFGGGIGVAPEASPYDEDMDVVLIERIAMIKIFYLVVLLLQQKHMKSKYVHHFKGKTVSLNSPTPQRVQTDGEISEPKPYDIDFTTASGLFWF